MNKADELRREIDIALKNASASDTVGRYDWAAYFEDRAQKMMEELKEVINNS